MSTRMNPPTLLPYGDPVHYVDRHSEDGQPRGSVLATDDHELIRRWAVRHSAEPATGEQTASGPATVDVNDGDAGIRFNFPAAGKFRSITWDEWFQNFTTYDLLFVYERDDASGRYRLVPREKLSRGDGSR